MKRRKCCNILDLVKSCQPYQSRTLYRPHVARPNVQTHTTPVQERGTYLEEWIHAGVHNYRHRPCAILKPLPCISFTRYLEWDDYFMALAFLSAQRSKDPNKQVNAITFMDGCTICILHCKHALKSKPVVYFMPPVISFYSHKLWHVLTRGYINGLQARAFGVYKQA